jgi:hypothetical protein
MTTLGQVLVAFLAGMAVDSLRPGYNPDLMPRTCCSCRFWEFIRLVVPAGVIAGPSMAVGGCYRGQKVSEGWKNQANLWDKDAFPVTLQIDWCYGFEPDPSQRVQEWFPPKHPEA